MSHFNLYHVAPSEAGCATPDDIYLWWDCPEHAAKAAGELLQRMEAKGIRISRVNVVRCTFTTVVQVARMEPLARTVHAIIESDPREDLVKHIKAQIQADPEAYANDAKLRAIADRIMGDLCESDEGA